MLQQLLDERGVAVKETITFKDRTLGIISIFVALLLLFSIKEKNFETKAFPVALLISFSVLSILLIIGKKRKTYKLKNLDKVILYYLLFFAYVVVIPYIGFIIATTCFMSLFIIMSKYMIKKIMVLVISLVVSLMTWYIFSVLFGISLPEILF